MPWFTKNPKYFHFIPYYVQGYLHKVQNKKKLMKVDISNSFLLNGHNPAKI